MNSDTRILINTKCELMVAPISDLSEEGYVYLEFVDGDDLDLMSTLTISHSPTLFKYYLINDGLYMYYRLKIATTELDINTENRLYFDVTTQKLMIGDTEVTESKQLRDVIDDASPNTKFGVIDLLEEPVFSICKISSCLENLQRKYIFNYNSLSNCKIDEDKNLRDFLFSTVFILKLLLKQQRYEEALKLLQSVNTCEICDSYVLNKNSCNCN